MAAHVRNSHFGRPPFELTTAYIGLPFASPDDAGRSSTACLRCTGWLASPIRIAYHEVRQSNVPDEGGLAATSHRWM